MMIDIENIKDVEHAFDPEFFIKKVDEENGVIVISYKMTSPETFPDNDSDLAKIRHEFRGIVFDIETGKLLRRPLHKFFNLNERENTRYENIDLNDRHFIMVKEDGSMIAPFINKNGKIIWGTKMGDTHLSPMVEEFVANRRDHYEKYVRASIEEGFTPIFEFCTNRNRIVLDYPCEKLVLLAVREMKTGKYLSFSKMKQVADVFAIPVVDRIPDKLTMDFIESTRNSDEPIEGFVIRFNNGHMLKIKTDQYCQIHRVKNDINNERRVVELVIENGIDDILPILPKEEADKLQTYANDVVSGFLEIVEEVKREIKRSKGMERKEYALSEKEFAWLAKFVFMFWDENPTDEEVYNAVVQHIVKQCNRTAKYLEMKKDGNILDWLPDWSPLMFDDGE